MRSGPHGLLLLMLVLTGCDTPWELRDRQLQEEQALVAQRQELAVLRQTVAALPLLKAEVAECEERLRQLRKKKGHRG